MAGKTAKMIYNVINMPHLSDLSDRKFLFSLTTGFLFLVISIGFAYFAIKYADYTASSPVTDIILSNTPVFNLDEIFVYGPVIFWVMTAIYAIGFQFRRVPFILKSIALFVFIRAIFITLTHIGPFPDHTITDVSNSFFSVFTSGSDLFFSSHTGLPFLMALVFWDKKYSRWFFLFSSFFFGAVVLMTHLHYSIDVAAAFFITYTIFKISKKLFKKDHLFFINGIQSADV